MSSNQIIDNSCDICDKECKHHEDNLRRISVLENKYTVVEENTITVNKLTSKVSLLLTIMSFVIFIVSGGAIYTFTGLNDFKDIYSLDRMNLQKQISTTQEKNTEKLTNAISSLQDEIGDRLDDFDERMDDFEKGMVKLETKIESVKE